MTTKPSRAAAAAIRDLREQHPGEAGQNLLDLATVSGQLAAIADVLDDVDASKFIVSRVREAIATIDTVWRRCQRCSENGP